MTKKKTTNFVKEYADLSEKVDKFIRNSVKKEVVFATQEELQIKYELIHELPAISNISKHGFYCEYAIVKVEKKGKNILLHTVGKGEVNDDVVFNLNDMYENHASIADTISKKL